MSLDKQERFWVVVLLLVVGLASGCQNSALVSAKFSLKQREPARATQQLITILETEPDDPEIFYLLGRAYGDQAKYELMATSFQRSVQLSEEFDSLIKDYLNRCWLSVYNQGVAHLNVANPDFSSAASFFQLATVIDRKRLDAWRQLAFTQYQLRNYNAAIQSYKIVATEAPADTLIFNTLGVLYMQTGDFPEAQRTFEHLLEFYPQHIGSLTNLAAIYTDSGRYIEAEEAYNAAVQIDPRIWQIHFNLGNLFWRQKKFSFARDAYVRALELNPADADIGYNLAVTYLALEDRTNALPLLENLSQRMPTDVSVWRELGRLYALEERVQESKAAYDFAEALGQ